MGEVNWDNVQGAETRAPEEKPGGILGTLVFIVLLVVGVIAGGSYVNAVMLGERVRDLALENCPAPACAVDVRAAHADCFSANVTYAVPGSMADFQTPPTSPKLGIGSVNLDGYQACVMPEKAKTLAEEEP